LVPNAKAALVGLQWRSDLDVSPYQVWCPGLVRQAHISAHPGGTAPRHFRYASGRVFVVREVIELEAERRFEARQRSDRGGGRTHVEDAQRVMRHRGVTPGPKELSPVNSVLNAVATKHTSFGPVEVASEFLAFGEEASAGEAAESLGDVLAHDFDFQRLAWLWLQSHPMISE